MRVQWKMHNSNKDVSTEQGETEQQINHCWYQGGKIYVYFSSTVCLNLHKGKENKCFTALSVEKRFRRKTT